MPENALPLYHREKAKYDASRINVVLDEDIFPDTDFISLNQGTGFGLLRGMAPDERPNPRDIVIYEGAAQRPAPGRRNHHQRAPDPLSHVNLRALQDGVPNGFIRDALDDTTIDSLIDSHVRYTVTRNGYTIRAATKTEVDAHYEASRPAAAQTPVRDLSVTAITALSDVEFGDWDAFGVKAANVAVLGTLGFAAGTVPDGFAVPFYFYDEFMKANELDAMVTTMLADADFQASYDTQEKELKKMRSAIKDSTTPAWIITALEAMHAEFPDGTSLRYRSSTNNEDLPGFSGAGLYDSKTQDPDETVEEVLHRGVAEVVAELDAVAAQHHRQRVGPPSPSRPGVVGLDARLQLIPGHEAVDAFEEQLTAGLALLLLELHAGERRLMPGRAVPLWFTRHDRICSLALASCSDCP